MFTDLGRLMMVVGALIFVVGLLIALGGRLLWFGNLPGDIAIERDNFRMYVPIGTMIVVSLLLTVVLNLVMRFFR
jgi:membrane protein implicated in regulation of membrane protease activity